MTAKRIILKITLSSIRSLAAAAALALPLGAHAQGPQSGSVQVGSASIAYRVQGHGPAIMLVHGYPLSGELFAKNRAALSRRYTVVTPDLRGFGGSTTPDSKGGVELYAKDMLAVMDHLHVRKAITGGMSMGGPVVFEMYREAPQRFRGMIPILMPQMLTTATRMGDPALIKFVSGIIKKVSVNAAVAGGDTLANRPDSRPTLAHVRVPVLIVEGADDPIYPVELQKMMRASRPGTKLAIIPGAAHAAIIEKPEACNRAIESFAAGIR